MVRYFRPLHRTVIVSFAFVLAFAGISAFAVSFSSPSGTTFYACLASRAGSLYNVTTGGVPNCQRGDTVIHWFSYDASQLDAAFVNEGQENSISTVMLQDSAVTNPKLADDSVSTDKIIDGSVVTVKLADGSVVTAKLADGSVTVDKLGDDSVITGKIVDGSVVTAKLADGSVVTAKLADDSVITGKIVDGSVTTAKLGDGSVSTDKIIDGSVTTAKLADLSVTTSKIANNSVTSDKLADGSVHQTIVDRHTVQWRVFGTCAAGMTVSAVHVDGGVECEAAGDSVRIFQSDSFNVGHISSRTESVSCPANFKATGGGVSIGSGGDLKVRQSHVTGTLLNPTGWEATVRNDHIAQSGSMRVQVICIRSS